MANPSGALCPSHPDGRRKVRLRLVKILSVSVLFSPKIELLLLRKSAPGLAMWRDKNPLPVPDGGHRSGGGGVLPWCRTRYDGTDLGAPYYRRTR